MSSMRIFIDFNYFKLVSFTAEPGLDSVMIRLLPGDQPAVELTSNRYGFMVNPSLLKIPVKFRRFNDEERQKAIIIFEASGVNAKNLPFLRQLTVSGQKEQSVKLGDLIMKQYKK